MCFIMIGTIPFQRMHWNVVCACNVAYLHTNKLHPLISDMVPKALRVFTFERNYHRVYISFVISHFCGRIIKVNRNIFIGEQPVCSFDSLHSWTCRNVIQIGFLRKHFRIVFQHRRNKLRCGTFCSSLQIALVFWQALTLFNGICKATDQIFLRF